MSETPVKNTEYECPNGCGFVGHECDGKYHNHCCEARLSEMLKQLNREKLEWSMGEVSMDEKKYTEQDLKAAYREGFSDGKDFHNIPWKYPPETIAYAVSETREKEFGKCDNAWGWYRKWKSLTINQRENVDWGWDCIFAESGEVYICDVTENGR